MDEIDHFKHASHGVKDWYCNNKPLVEQGYDNAPFRNDAARMMRDSKGRHATVSLSPLRRRTRRSRHRSTI